MRDPYYTEEDLKARICPKCGAVVYTGDVICPLCQALIQED